jgi:ATP-dependent exoDNAse (exonuclease V) beta subunit
MLVEVPFQRCLPTESSDRGVPTILRGVIDLVFRETAGWVIVDYKTDAAAATSKDRLVDHYRGQIELYAKEWEQIIDQPVSEKAIFFTATSEYVPL